jgi:hypothetical protein
MLVTLGEPLMVSAAPATFSLPPPVREPEKVCAPAA